MAQVEIQAGPHRFVSLLSREAVDELGSGAGSAGRRGGEGHQRAPSRSRGCADPTHRPTAGARTSARRARSSHASHRPRLVAASGRSRPAPAAGRAAADAGAGGAGAAASASSSVAGDITVLAAGLADRVVQRRWPGSSRRAHPGVTVTLELRRQLGAGHPDHLGGPRRRLRLGQHRRPWMPWSPPARLPTPRSSRRTSWRSRCHRPTPARSPAWARWRSADVKTALCQPQVPCGSTARAGVHQREVHRHAGHPGARREVGAEQGAARRGRRRRRLRDRRARRRGARSRASRSPPTSTPPPATRSPPLTRSENAATAAAFVEYVLSPEGAAAPDRGRLPAAVTRRR